MEGKHTPGPWFYRNEARRSDSEDDFTVLRRCGGDLPGFNILAEHIQTEEDARIIADAYDLLEACEGMVNYYCEDCLHNPDDCLQCANLSVRQAKAAIAKARGEAR